MSLDVPLRVLVVDDSALYRKVVSDALSQIQGVTVVNSAANGKIALARIAQYSPDLITLDIEMPEIDGLGVLEQLRKEKIQVGVIMLSSHSYQGGEMTMRALELGAFDFIPKPMDGTMQENQQKILSDIEPKIRAYARKLAEAKGHTPSVVVPRPVAAPSHSPAATTAAAQVQTVSPAPARRAARPEAVVIGVSTGGPFALARVIPKLPANLGVPVFIVQHMPALFTRSLAENLNGKSALEVVEAEDMMHVRPNRVYIAPGGRQMKLTRPPEGVLIRITDDPPENSCRPSVDYMFRSALGVYGGKLTAVIMTGMGGDGAREMVKIREAGATTIAQDQASCVVFGMPKEAIEMGAAGSVVPLENLAQEILKTVQ